MKRFEETYRSARVQREVMGKTPPFLFVGHQSYPFVSWGPLVGATETAVFAEEKSLFGKSIDEILMVRHQLLRGTRHTHVKQRDVLLEKAQETVMSIKPVDVEITFTKEPVHEPTFSTLLTPMGPSAPVEKMRVVDNPVIPHRVEEVYEESMPVWDAFSLLTTYDVYYLSRLLASGVIGKKEERRLVPTRWSITATDDILGKQIMEKVREFPSLNDMMLFSFTYLDNHYEVILLPGAWEFEQLEAWAPQTFWMRESQELLQREQKCGTKNSYQKWWQWYIVQENERYKGRKKYAEKEGGGYYAARLAVLEYLQRMRKQARVLVIREIGEKFTIPVGVWQVRESIRHALLQTPLRFSTQKELFSEISQRTRIPFQEYKKRSEVLSQHRLE